MTSLSTTSLNFFKSTETGFNLSTSNLSTLLFKLFKPLGGFSNSSICDLSTPNFTLAKSAFSANFDVSTVAFFQQILMYQQLRFLIQVLLHN